MNPPRGDGTLLLSLHLLIQEIEKLILKRRATGDPQDDKLKPASVLKPPSPTRLVLKIPVLFFPVAYILFFIAPYSSVKLTYLGLQMKDPQRQASELREKLLRDKIKKMRTTSTDP